MFSCANKNAAGKAERKPEKLPNALTGRLKKGMS